MGNKTTMIIWTTVAAICGCSFAFLIMFITLGEALKWFEIMFQGLIGTLIVSLVIFYLTQDYQKRQEKARRINKAFILINEITKHHRFLIELSKATNIVDLEGYIALGAHLNLDWDRVKHDLHDLPHNLVRFIFLHQGDIELYQKFIEKDTLSVVLNDKMALRKQVQRANAILEGFFSITDPENRDSHLRIFETYYSQYGDELRNESD